MEAFESATGRPLEKGARDDETGSNDGSGGGGLVGLSADRHVMASDSDVLARFDGGTGVIPVSSVAPPQNADLTFANVVQNVVRGVAPSGQPWTIADLKAIVHTDGRIRVVGRGLVLNGGNRIGQSLFLKVFATVLCSVSLPFVQHSTNTMCNSPIRFSSMSTAIFESTTRWSLCRRSAWSPCC